MPNFKIVILIALAGALIFIPFIGGVHLFDWDEINFAEAAREMIVTGDYFHVQIDFAPFWEKPPLFIWLQAISMLLFGVGEFSARLPNALIGILTLIVLYLTGQRLFDRNFGLLWVLVYAGSLLPHFYFRTGIIDPLFNLCMFLGIVFLVKHYSEWRNSSGRTNSGQRSGFRDIAISGFFVGLAVMTKGPVGYLLPVMVWGIYWILRRRKQTFPLKEGLLFTTAAAAVTFIWFGVDYIQNGPWFLTEFIRYQIRLLTTGDAGHGGPVYYHLLILLLGCFPASVFALHGFRSGSGASDRQRNFHLWMVLLLIVVVVVFSLVKTKIVHYSSMAYFPVTFLATIALMRIFREGMKHKPVSLAAVGVIGFTVALVVFAVPFAGLYPEYASFLVDDKAARAALQADVQWSGWELLIGIGYMVAISTGLYFLIKNQRRKGTFVLFGSTILTLSLIVAILTPRIERYSQGAMVDFFKSLQGKAVYVEVLGFKSYAHLFYTRKTPELSASHLGIHPDEWEKWLLTGEIDKPALFVAKSHRAQKWREHPNLRLIDEMNGWSFFERVGE